MGWACVRLWDEVIMGDNYDDMELYYSGTPPSMMKSIQDTLGPLFHAIVDVPIQLRWDFNYSCYDFQYKVTYSHTNNTVEPLNVNTLKSGHLFYTGHFVWSQTCTISPLKSGHLSNQDTSNSVRISRFHCN